MAKPERRNYQENLHVLIGFFLFYTTYDIPLQYIIYTPVLLFLRIIIVHLSIILSPQYSSYYISLHLKYILTKIIFWGCLQWEEQGTHIGRNLPYFRISWCLGTVGCTAPHLQTSWPRRRSNLCPIAGSLTSLPQTSSIWWKIRALVNNIFTQDDGGTALSLFLSNNI